jgi:hypothetical protein
MTVSRHTLLRVAPDVTVRYRDGAEVEIALGPERLSAGPHGISILEAFRTATTMGAVLDRLGAQTTGMQDWIELSAMITGFAEIGILVDVAAVPAPALNPDPGRFDSARVHVGMLDDRTRTDLYLTAIRAVVRPGDVVVEIGTGTGVLAVAAAQAGAARVYAIETSSIGQVAKRVFQANGLSDRITLVEGLSSRVALPERCDVLIAELIGKDPLEEGVLEFTRDGVARFLKPEGRLIPSQFEVDALPVELPDDVLRHWTFTEAGTAEWRAAYGIDFSPLVEASRQSLWRMSVAPRRLRSFAAMTAPLPLLERDLARLAGVGFVERATSTVLKDGAVHGVVLSFSATLAPGVVLDTDPREYRADNSWDYQFWGLPAPLTVRQGEQLEVTLRHRLDGPPVEVRLLNE